MVVVVVAFVVVVVMVRGPVATMTVEVGMRHTEPAGRQVGGWYTQPHHSLGQLTHLHQPRMPGLMHRPSQSIYNACPPPCLLPSLFLSSSYLVTCNITEKISMDPAQG